MAAEPRFRLRQPNSDKPQPITLVIRHKDLKVTIPTGWNIHPEHWNFRDQKVRNKVEAKNKDDINKALTEFYDAAELTISELKKEENKITRELIKFRFNEILERIDGVEKQNELIVDLFSFIDSFIKLSKNRINPNTGELLSPSTIRKYINTKDRLLEFKKIYDRPVDFDFIDLEFYHDFIDFLYEERRYALNTVGKYIKTLKEFLNDATEKRINKTLHFRNRKFKVLTEEVDAIYLNYEELTEIFIHDFTKNTRLDKARDIFLIGAFTGLRFGDFNSLRKSNIQNNEYIFVNQQKSKGKVVIPIHPVLKQIIKKYEWDFPKPISNQNLNDYIKEVCEAVEINQIITTSKTKAGQRVVESNPKYQLVSTHTARRSFATNLYKSGFPAISIMKITGHKTEKSFLKYIRVTPEEHAEMLKKHWEETYKSIKQ